jgi:hypothetical protein
MSRCSVVECDAQVENKDHRLCYGHWKAQKAGELSACEKCGRLKADSKPICLACFRSGKAAPEAAREGPEKREAGQGAREKADELARKHPVMSFVSKVTFGLIRSEDYSWRVGADSEEEVGRELARLPKGWFVRHDIMIGRNWNADHVVVGPPGVFVLDTKYRTGDVRTTKAGIRVNGYKTDMAEKVKDQAREVSRRLRDAAGLKSWVQPVLVFDNDIGGRREPDGVHVVDLFELVDYLRKMPRELDAKSLEQVSKALLTNGTWTLTDS